MSALIHLMPPVEAGPDAQRVFYSVGRTLSAADFVMQSRYVDARLLGLTPAQIGVISGLGVSPSSYSNLAGAAQNPAFAVGSGTGLGSDGRLVHLSAPLTFAWSDLINSFGASPPADGVYVLLLRTEEVDGFEGPVPDAASAQDPLLDLRQDSFVELTLSAQLSPLPSQLTESGVDQALNILIHGLTPDALRTAIGNGVPIALVMIGQSKLLLLSQAAGRVAAADHPIAALLLAQVRDVFTAALTELGPGASADAFAPISQRLRYLPGACELPLSLLKAPASFAPTCPFFPASLTVYLQAIPSSQAQNLLADGLGRPAVDLLTFDGSAVTLSLAIPDAAWTPTLLDQPQADPILPADLHLAFAAARAAQIQCREHWIALYGGINTAQQASPQALAFLNGADAAAQNLAYLLSSGKMQAQDLLAAADSLTTPPTFLSTVASWITTAASLAGLPAPLPATPSAAAIAAQLANFGYAISDPEPGSFADSSQPAPVVSSDTVLAPLIPYLPPHSQFADWLGEVTPPEMQIPADEASGLGPWLPPYPNPALLPPLIQAGVYSAGDDRATQAAAFAAWIAVPNATEPDYNDATPGALLQLAALQLYYAVLARVARAHEYWLEGHARLIALQRQHLDMMSTYVSAVAGGIPADGSGLSVTRTIPFFDLTPSATADTTPPSRGVFRMRTLQFRSTEPSAEPAKPAVASAAPTAARSASATMMAGRSAVAAAPISDAILASPTISRVGTLFGSQSDVAKLVAADTGAVSQGPLFDYTPVQYGTASHVTSGATLFQSASEGLKALRGVMNQSPINIVPPTALPVVPAATDETANYIGVIDTTRALLADITLVENNAIRIEADYLKLRDRLQAMETLASQWTAAVADARDALRTAQTAAATAAGNYAAAQSLVAEETARVIALAAARTQAIGQATGLFMVRQLQTPIARRPFGAVTLVADTPQDLAPACLADHPGPPASLTPFLDLLLETGLNDWRALQGRWTDLPDNAGLQRLLGLRTARLASFNPSTDFGSGAAAADLARIAASVRGAINPVLHASFSLGASLALNQQTAFRVFSLPDLMTLQANALRAKAEALRSRMEDATGCLYAILTSLPPSARFTWASAARAGSFNALDFQQWPLPSGPTDATNTVIRQLAALVGWMASQLIDGASAAAQTALGHLVSAAVIASAYGDPDEAVNGTVVSAGGAPRPGWPIRVILNRPPPIGTVLNLFDVNRTIIGTVKVQDHDSFGSSATIVSLFTPVGTGAGLTVASQHGRSAWLPS